MASVSKIALPVHYARLPAMLGLLWYIQAKRRRRAINAASSASHPAGLRLSDAKLRRLCPRLYLTTGPAGFAHCLFGHGLATRAYLRDMLVHGDSRAAVVLSTDPVLVACYCDDLDGVCVLRFDPQILDDVVLAPGDRLLTVLNSGSLDRPARPGEVAADVVQGERADPRYVNFWPLVAEFLSDDADLIERRKDDISDREYERCRTLGREHVRRLPGVVRDGRPDRSWVPAT